MKVQIASIFPAGESPRYIFGKSAANGYVVFSPIDAGLDFHGELGDTVKFEQVSQGPAEAINLTRDQTVPVLIHDFGINEDIIRVRYDSQFCL